jgi:hypothetical protein
MYRIQVMNEMKREVRSIYIYCLSGNDRNRKDAGTTFYSLSSTIMTAHLAAKIAGAVVGVLAYIALLYSFPRILIWNSNRRVRRAEERAQAQVSAYLSF